MDEIIDRLRADVEDGLVRASTREDHIRWVRVQAGVQQLEEAMGYAIR